MVPHVQLAKFADVSTVTLSPSEARSSQLAHQQRHQHDSLQHGQRSLSTLPTIMTNAGNTMGGPKAETPPGHFSSGPRGLAGLHDFHDVRAKTCACGSSSLGLVGLWSS